MEFRPPIHTGKTVHHERHTIFPAQSANTAQRYPNPVMIHAGEIKEYEISLQEFLVLQITNRYAVLFRDEDVVAKVPEHERKALSMRRIKIQEENESRRR
jgi:hypothetical protein